MTNFLCFLSLFPSPPLTCISMVSKRHQRLQVSLENTDCYGHVLNSVLLGRNSPLRYWSSCIFSGSANLTHCSFSGFHHLWSFKFTKPWHRLCGFKSQLLRSLFEYLCISYAAVCGHLHIAGDRRYTSVHRTQKRTQHQVAQYLFFMSSNALRVFLSDLFLQPADLIWWRRECK